MKRNELVEILVIEGLSEKTLSNFTDKQIYNLAKRFLLEDEIKVEKKPAEPGKPATPPKGERDVITLPKNLDNKTLDDFNASAKSKISGKVELDMAEELKGKRKRLDKNKNGVLDKEDFKLLRKEKKVIKKEKPSAHLTKKKKSEVVKKAKKGEDIGKKGKGFEKIEKKAAKKYGSKEKGKKVAAAAMWKNIKRESVEEVEEWIDSLSENIYHPITTKGEIMELIKIKLYEQPEVADPDIETEPEISPDIDPSVDPDDDPYFDPFGNPGNEPDPRPKMSNKRNSRSLPDFMKYDNIMALNESLKKRRYAKK